MFRTHVLSLTLKTAELGPGGPTVGQQQDGSQALPVRDQSGQFITYDNFTSSTFAFNLLWLALMSIFFCRTATWRDLHDTA